ncbi:SRSF protein kinase 3-like isoform X2 [Gordionus sp. m RMFG-2023]|uniref:SRSF protein kinase 3-like isoform X2 n=1 Tax=Gordionus sp. m RMFG-2023 TaxID=3053472 RepID=UPI0031FC5C2A
MKQQQIKQHLAPSTQQPLLHDKNLTSIQNCYLDSKQRSPASKRDNSPVRGEHSQSDSDPSGSRGDGNDDSENSPSPVTILGKASQITTNKKDREAAIIKEDKEEVLCSDDEDEQEDPQDYCKGGYHSVMIGDLFNERYHVIRKMGWGHFSTVWLCWDIKSKGFVAMKVVKSASHYTESALDEIKLLRCVRDTAPNNSYREKTVQLLDDFKITGLNGTHVCMVFEVLGHNLLKLIIRCSYRGIPLINVKRIIKQVLQGLYYLHYKCRIIHTDIKPENILITIPDDYVRKLALETIFCINAGHKLPISQLSTDPLHKNEKPDTYYLNNLGGHQSPTTSSPLMPKSNHSHAENEIAQQHTPLKQQNQQPLTPNSVSKAKKSHKKKKNNNKKKLNEQGENLISKNFTAYNTTIPASPDNTIISPNIAVATLTENIDDFDTSTVYSSQNSHSMKPGIYYPSSFAGSCTQKMSQNKKKKIKKKIKKQQQTNLPSQQTPQSPNDVMVDGKEGDKRRFVCNVILKDIEKYAIIPKRQDLKIIAHLAGDNANNHSEQPAGLNSNSNSSSVLSSNQDNTSETSSSSVYFSSHSQPCTALNGATNKTKKTYYNNSGTNYFKVVDKDMVDYGNVARSRNKKEEPITLPAENITISTKPTGPDPALEDSPNLRVKIADLGNACWVHKHFTEDIQTRQYRSLEVLLGSSYDSSADIWSTACMAFELATGDYLFEAHSGKDYSRDEDHIALIIELLGHIPSSIALGGKYSKELFNKQGRLKRITNLRPYSLFDLLTNKYDWDSTCAREFSDFLLPMLHCDSSKRATAGECLVHPWFSDT